MPRNSEVFNSPDGKAQTWLVVGKSRKGKSHFIRWLIMDRFVHANWQFGLSMVGTKFTGAYKWLPDRTVFEGYDENRLVAYVTGLKKKIDAGEKVPPNFVYLDDLVGALKSETDAFKQFCTTSRHTNTNVIVAVQYIAHGVSTTFREQVDYAVLFGSKNRRTCDSLFGEFGQLFPSRRDFTDYLHEQTKRPYHAVLYIEREEELGKNYHPVVAPADLPSGVLKFRYST